MDGWELLALERPVCLPAVSFLSFFNIDLSYEYTFNIPPILNEQMTLFQAIYT
jgi:hypothetical protein